MKGWVFLIIGRVLCVLTNLRNRAQAECWKRELGSADPTAILEYPLTVANSECIHIGAGSRISAGGELLAVSEYRGKSFQPEIEVGENVHLGRNCHLVATRKISIGDDVLVANNVYVSDNLHEYRDPGRPVMRNELISCGEVQIGAGAWIGENACVVGDVRIGRNCVVGANAVVRRSLPDYSVAVGAPARVIKRYHLVRKRWEPTDAQGRFFDDPECRPSARRQDAASREYGFHA